MSTPITTNPRPLFKSEREGKGEGEKGGVRGGTEEEERGKGVENALGTLLVETKAHSACEEERLACGKRLEGTYVLNVSISPVRLIRSVRLTSTFSLSFSSSCQKRAEVCLMIAQRCATLLRITE